MFASPGISFLVSALLLAAAPVLSAGQIDFEGLSDSTFVTTQFPGLTFSNTIALSSGISLNELDFPPSSGITVASDFGGPMSILFSTPAISFLAYFTYSIPVTIQGFDSSNNLLSSASSPFSTNTVSGGDPGSSPNDLIQITSASGFSRVVLTGASSGASFTVDDISFVLADDGGAVPEPRAGLLAFTGFAMLLLAGKAKRRSWSA